ncbi:MAG TPA: sarcosine oxidase subunit alpha family protein [Steroidobacteraceae bacterium]|nr:sarcosine oxidase subunit alpha family protein [Steroidobacteraceae bacterium]
MSDSRGRISRQQPNRLQRLGVVDRSQPLNFQFDGRRYGGFAGDTVASALLAAGVRLVGRSFKYHRPRGLLTAGSEEPNALIELRGGARREPNTRATVAELFEGLEARSQNSWPGVGFDLGAVNSLLSPIFVAGFYYKTFMWPAALWEKLYEPLIRRAAGLGRATHEADPDSYDKFHAFCDLLVIGAGPAGLAAALAAGRSGARVILCEEDFILGGRLNGDRQLIDEMSGRDWVWQIEAELRSLSGVRILPRTTVFGAYDAGLTGARTYGALERVCDHLAVPPAHRPRQRLWKIVARHAVLAAGALERPIVFGDNDRPGIMTGAAVRTYLNRFGVAPGRRAAVFTCGDDGWRTAADLKHAGVAVEAVIDSRTEADPALVRAAELGGAQVLLGSQVVGTAGWQRLSRITVRGGGRTAQFSVDLLAVSGGWNPNVALSTHLGGKPRWSAGLSAFVPGDLPRGMSVAGACGGAWALGDALREGAKAGAQAATAAGYAAGSIPSWSCAGERVGLTPLWHVESSTGKAFVDFQHDVTSEDVALAAREGYRSVEHLKRYTTLGMATDQGKTSNLNGLAIMAALTERSIPSVGTTTARPPFTPVSIGALAGPHRGKHFRPTRLTAGHDWAKERGATFVEAGQWLRAQWFARSGESSWQETVSREVRAVRAGVGVCDVSTLGKIDIQGADAAAFLDRVYINVFSSLPVGKSRYGLMLREDGFVMDDGTTAQIAKGHYLMSTTTANAAGVMQHLEHARQILWPELDVQIVSVTEQWAQYAVAGPKSRELLQRLLGDALDLSDGAFPYLACAEFSWRNVRARLFRISFSGELAYELAVPARFGDAAIRAIMSAGASLDVTPYGTEALGVMRIEKGHVAGNELNGTTTATDLGLGRMMSRKKDFIGRVLAERPGLTDPERPALVGIRPVDGSARLYAGAHFLQIGATPSLENDQGYLTSVALSPMLGTWIGLGFLRRGPERHGERIRAFCPIRGGDAEVEVVSPVFFDPQGARLHV